LVGEKGPMSSIPKKRGQEGKRKKKIFHFSSSAEWKKRQKNFRDREDGGELLKNLTNLHKKKGWPEQMRKEGRVLPVFPRKIYKAREMNFRKKSNLAAGKKGGTGEDKKLRTKEKRTARRRREFRPLSGEEKCLQEKTTLLAERSKESIVKKSQSKKRRPRGGYFY